MSQTKRRTNGIPSTTSNPTEPPAQTPKSTSPSTSSTTRFLLLSIYPAILLTGSLFSLLEPHARSTPYSTLTQSHPPELAPSYFARKSNILNQYFVKILWLWISGAFALFLAVHPLTGNALNNSRRKIQALLRYAVVTGLWIVTTQWCFGPPLIDRGFRLSGGRCEAVLDEQGHVDIDVNMDDDMHAEKLVGDLVTAAACKLAGGRWAGGHDISGHVFILILGSGFLALEVWPVLQVFLDRGWDVIGERARELAQEEDASDQKRRNADKVIVLGSEGDEREWGLSMGVIASVVGVALWMLLMTATYFHTWFEKLTGLLVAFAGIGLVYVLPHYVPLADSILGKPGQ